MGFAQFMQGGGWALFALVAAMFSAVFFLINQYLKMPGHLLVFWMRVLAVLCLTPLVATLTMPVDPRFYIGVALTVVFSMIGDIRTFNASARFGGGVVSRVQPMVVWGAFFLWFLFDPHLLSTYAARPLNSLGILAALGGCVFFAMRLNRCAVTREALRMMLPALAAYACVTVLNKYALGHGNMQGAVYGYMYVQSVLAVLVSGGYAIWRERAATPEQSAQWKSGVMVAATLMATFAWICHMTYKNYAMVFTDNPSFQAAIGLTAPVFISVYYHFTGHREEGDRISGYGVVACALALVLLTVRPA